MTNSRNNEKWVEILGYEGLYSVSTHGRIASHHWGKYRILRQRKSGKGYMLVNLSKDGKLKTFKVHSLVATHFLTRPDGLSEINHKDEDKSNNRVDNLEWCSRSYNVNYGSRIAKQRLRVIKGVDRYTLGNHLIASYDSITMASQDTGLSVSNISACCKKKRNSAGGFIWRYTEEVRNA